MTSVLKKKKAVTMAEVEKKPPGLPEEVPKELRMELERLQRQIKVLLNNYQVREVATPSTMVPTHHTFLPNPENLFC